MKNPSHSVSKSVSRPTGRRHLLGALVLGSLCFAAACGSDAPAPGADASTDASVDSGSEVDTGVDSGAGGETDSGVDGGTTGDTDAGADDLGFTDAGQPPGCGDGITQRILGETCDDGNRVSGDGCDESCRVEPQELDLSSTSTVGLRRRTFLGQGVGSQLAYMAAGDVTGDGQPEFFAGAQSRPGGAFGILYAYETGPDFFDIRTSSPVASSTVASGSLFQILGEDVGDEFGGGGLAGNFVADVTGDGVGDLVVSASQADGVGNLPQTLNAGEIYVFAGGPALAAAGIVNLANTSSSGLVIAQIQGPAAGAQAHAIAVGDANGDGIADILVGAPTADGGAGRVYIVLGGPTLAGRIDLADGVADSRILAVFQGGTPDLPDQPRNFGDRLGSGNGVIDQIGGSAALDVVFGAPNRDTPVVGDPRGQVGGDRAGVVYAFLGPIARGEYNVGGTLGANTTTWLSGDPFASVGTGIAVGNFTGSAANEVLIGGRQMINRNLAFPAWQRGGVQIWRGPIAQGVLDGTQGVVAQNRVYGAEFGDLAGNFITTGDMNGDGIVDLITSSGAAAGEANSRTNAGETTVILGAPSLSAEVDLATFRGQMFLIGPRTNSQIGLRKLTAIASDLDGDGKDDLCVGAWGSSVASVECIKSPW